MFSYEMLVNSSHKLPRNFRPPVMRAPDIPFAAKPEEEKRFLEARAARHAERLFQAAKAEGLSLYGISGFRSYARQEQLYQNALLNIKKNLPENNTSCRTADTLFCSSYDFSACSKMNSSEITTDSPSHTSISVLCDVAAPGCSEHQTGLALDVSCPAVSLNLTENFGETDEGKWLLRHAPLYGFVLRYPKGKEHITKIPNEPWHIRYVTKSLALCLTITGQVLEEYYTITAPSGVP